MSSPPLAWALIACILGAWVGVMLWNGTERQWSFATVQAHVAPGWGGWTHIILPPAGALHARTHRAPVTLTFRVEKLYLKETADWLTRHTTPTKAGYSLMTALRQLMVRLLLGTLAAALIGASVTAVLIRCSWRQGISVVAAGLLSVAAPLGIAAFTYRTEAFANPTLSGELARTANFASMVQTGYRNAVTQLPMVSRQIADLIRQMESATASAPRDQAPATPVLVISDLHNNPLAARAAIRMAHAHRARLVLVCGDVSDYGHPLEGELLSVWRQFHVPVLVVLGNHDSRSIGRTLQAIPGVTVLDNGQVRRAAGLSVMGYADPASRRENLGSVDPTQRDLDTLAVRIRRTLQRRTKPDVVMVHNFRVAARLAGYAPLIVTGHSHSASVIQLKGSTIVNPGSTGAAGLRYLTAKDPQPHSAAVMRFTEDGGRPVLVSTDIVKLFQPSGDFEIRRQHVRHPPSPVHGESPSQRTR